MNKDFEAELELENEDRIKFKEVERTKGEIGNVFSGFRAGLRYSECESLERISLLEKELADIYQRVFIDRAPISRGNIELVLPLAKELYEKGQK